MREQYGILLQLLNREDSLRTLNGNRAGSIIAANALLFTGAVFLLDKTVSILSQRGVVVSSIFYFTILVFSFSICCSIWKAVRCLTNPFSDVIPPNILKFAHTKKSSKITLPLKKVIISAENRLKQHGAKKETEGHRLFFNPKDTVSEFKTFQDMLKDFKKISYDRLVSYGIAELMFVTRIRNKQIVNLRVSIRLFMLAVLVFIIYLAFVLTLNGTLKGIKGA